MHRLPLLSLLAVLTVPAAGLAAPFEFLHYKNAKGLSRMCRGDVATGEVICADGTASSAEQTGDAAPAWEVSATAKTTFLKYQSPFEKPGHFTFFAYNHSRTGEARVCVGNTATGEIRCADAASHSAEVKGVEKPAWQVDDKSKVRVLRYFASEKAGKPGTFSFGPYYSNKGDVRVCQMETGKGVTLCADSTAQSWQRVGEGKLTPEPDTKGKTTFFRYFEQL